MQVIGQNADRNRFERQALLNRCVEPTQAIDLAHQQITRSIGKRYSEEEDPTIDFRTPVSRHGDITLAHCTRAGRVGTALRAFAHPTNPPRRRGRERESVQRVEAYAGAAMRARQLKAAIALMAAGPKITTNNTGRKNTIIGTVSLGGRAAAFFSASAMRMSRFSWASTRSVCAIGVP